MEFFPFLKARSIVRSLGLKSSKEWREYKMNPPGIPRKPEKVYKDKGWKGYKDWLVED